MTRPLRIAQVAPPFERVPPRAYGGTERIVHGLVTELDRRGHEVTTFASGDSVVPGRHIETVPEALRPLGYAGDSLPYMQQTLHEVLAHASEFDLIHAHLEWASLLLARVSPVPVVTTFHGRLDLPWADALLAATPRPGWSRSARTRPATHPDVPWAGVVHNGLRLDRDAVRRTSRTDALCFVGRVVPEKGIVEAIEIAKAAGRPLRIAAKAGPTAVETRLLRRRLPAGAEGRGLPGRVPRRARPGRSRPALRRELRLADARLVAGAVRSRRHRVAGLRHAGHRAAHRRAARDPARRRRWLLRRRRRGDGVQGRSRRRSRSTGDPRVRPRPLLGRAHDRRLRGGLPRRCWSSPARPTATPTTTWTSPRPWSHTGWTAREPRRPLSPARSPRRSGLPRVCDIRAGRALPRR